MIFLCEFLIAEACVLSGEIVATRAGAPGSPNRVSLDTVQPENPTRPHASNPSSARDKNNFPPRILPK